MNGNITSKVATLLLGQGAPVRVVGRNARSLASLKAAGADIATGDIGDAGFLGQAFAGAIAAAGLRRVVNPSSVGARLGSGTGPIAGLHRQERRLDELAGVDVLHLRPGYFFENHLIAIEMIRTIGAYSDMTAPDASLPMVATADIAEVVARELRTPSGKGKRVLHLRAPSLYTRGWGFRSWGAS